MTREALLSGYSVAYRPQPDGVLAEVWFPYGGGGGATVGRDMAAAQRQAAELVEAHRADHGKEWTA